MHRVRYLLLAYTCDLDNDNLSDVRQHQTSLHRKFRDHTLPHISLSHVLPMTDCISSREAINAIELFWKTSMIFPSFKLRDFSPWILARREMNCYSGRMHKRDSRARLNVSQYKRNRRATCVHFLLLIYAFAFIRKATFKKMHSLCTIPYHGTTLLDIKFDIFPE